MKFIKYQALGNDYLVFEHSQVFEYTAHEISKICDRHYGIGSDGILFMDISRKDDFYLRILNPDGSEAEKSGNGLRIFSRYLWDSGMVGEERFQINTNGGLVTSQVSAKGQFVKVDMGKANFSMSEANMLANPVNERMINFPLELDGKEVLVNLVSMGNPHCVVFQDKVDSLLAQTMGPVLEAHPIFLHKSNVQFVEYIDRNNIKIEIWERGAGYTYSSGTSSCAAASVCVLKGICDSFVNVHMPGGAMEVQVDESYGVTMGGAVSRVGTVELDSEIFDSLQPSSTCAI